MEEGVLIEGENNKELAPALIAVHPLEKFIVVAIGSELRVFDMGINKVDFIVHDQQCRFYSSQSTRSQCSISLSDSTGGPSHSDAIRAIEFDTKGRFFASAGDDKLVKIWKTESWQCIRSVCSEKRVSAVAISHDGLFVIFADKFGVVWVLGLDEDDVSQESVDKTAVPILGHYCSIITSLEFSPDGRFIATADRDFKIRITKFPRRPLKGAHEIQSFCLGHTDFVSCLAFVSSPDYPVGLLMSGSGDATVRLWDYITGCLLDTCEVGLKAGLVATSEAEKDSGPAVTDIQSFPNGSLVAVAIQSLNGVILVKCELSARSLSIAKVVSMDDGFVPTRIGLSFSAGLLWMVMGASNLSTTSSSTQQVARLKVISSLEGFLLDSNGCDPVVVDDNDVPGGQSLLATLQGRLDVSTQEGTLAATAAALKVAMHNLLIKKQYSVEKRELRKKSRNDRKQK